jgi:hypothetical protein
MTDNFDQHDAERPEPRRRSIRQIPIPENRRVRRTPASQPARTIEHSYEPAPEQEYEEEVEQREERPARVRDGHFERIGRRLQQTLRQISFLKMQLITPLSQQLSLSVRPSRQPQSKT